MHSPQHSGGGYFLISTLSQSEVYVALVIFIVQLFLINFVFFLVPRLKTLCKHIIRKSSRPEEIKKLSIPRMLKMDLLLGFEKTFCVGGLDEDYSFQVNTCDTKFWRRNHLRIMMNEAFKNKLPVCMRILFSWEIVVRLAQINAIRSKWTLITALGFLFFPYH